MAFACLPRQPPTARGVAASPWLHLCCGQAGKQAGSQLPRASVLAAGMHAWLPRELVGTAKPAQPVNNMLTPCITQPTIPCPPPRACR